MVFSLRIFPASATRIEEPIELTIDVSITGDLLYWRRESTIGRESDPGFRLGEFSPVKASMK